MVELSVKQLPKISSKKLCTPASQSLSNLSVCLSVRPSVRPFVYLCVGLCVGLSVCLSVFLSACP